MRGGVRVRVSLALGLITYWALVIPLDFSVLFFLGLSELIDIGPFCFIKNVFSLGLSLVIRKLITLKDKFRF